MAYAAGMETLTVPIAVTDFNHVRLTVSDIDVSRKFYDDVFGFDVAFEWDPNADEETKKSLWFLFGGVIYYRRVPRPRQHRTGNIGAE